MSSGWLPGPASLGLPGRCGAGREVPPETRAPVSTGTARTRDQGPCVRVTARNPGGSCQQALSSLPQGARSQPGRTHTGASQDAAVRRACGLGGDGTHSSALRVAAAAGAPGCRWPRCTGWYGAGAAGGRERQAQPVWYTSLRRWAAHEARVKPPRPEQRNPSCISEGNEAGITRPVAGRLPPGSLSAPPDFLAEGAGGGGAESSCNVGLLCALGWGSPDPWAHGVWGAPEAWRRSRWPACPQRPPSTPTGCQGAQP